MKKLLSSVLVFLLTLSLVFPAMAAGTANIDDIRANFAKDNEDTMAISTTLEDIPVSEEPVIPLSNEEPSPAYFSGSVIYQPSTRKATVQLYSSTGNLLATVTTSVEGYYMLSATADSGYTLVVTKPGYLSYTIKNLTLVEGTAIEPIDIMLISGDVNGDGVVNAVDLAQFLSEFNRYPIFFTNADIDGNGIVNATDLTYLLAGFNKRNIIITINVIPLLLNTPSTVLITSGSRREVRFTAPYTGSYTFTSSNRGSLDPKAYTGLTGTGSLDDNSADDGRNYMFKRALTAGQTYTYYSGVYNDSIASGSYTVTVISTEVIGTRRTWEYSDYSNGSYVPRTGYADPTFYNKNGSGTNYVMTFVSFTFDSNNVSSIIAFNNGTNPIDNKFLYVGLDIRSVRNVNSSIDMMDAYSIATSLPNPKTDLENDPKSHDSRFEESEVVALGTVEAKSYYMSTMWYDHRSDESNHTGEWRVQFHMSGQYVPVLGGWIRSFGDYNTVWMASRNQAILPYGKDGGKE